MSNDPYAIFYFLKAEKNSTPESFKRALNENGAEFADSFVDNLLRLIRHMKTSLVRAERVALLEEL